VKFIIVLGLLFSGVLLASVDIANYRNFSWNDSWNEDLRNQLGKEEFKALMNGPVDEDDLKVLSCPGFNLVKDPELKKDFWIVFLSSLVRAESAFNPKAQSKAPKGGHGNYGLLQFSKRTAREHCALVSMEQIANPEAHLRCGVKLLNWQLEGAPNALGKLLRKDLKNQLFGKGILLWGPLRQNDKKGRALLVGWFKKHRDQLPFCEG
jgi:hypothetical protein